MSTGLTIVGMMAACYVAVFFAFLIVIFVLDWHDRRHMFDDREDDLLALRREAALQSSQRPGAK